jgi:membrane protein implicated in regulation of membrane protease activity
MRMDPRLSSFAAAAWALAGAVVVLFVFFALIGGITPAQATVVTVIVAVLAVAWAVRLWRRRSNVPENRIARADRERRGF